MEAQTIAVIAIISPILTGVGLLIAGGMWGGKLSNRLKTVEEKEKKMIGANGRSVYVTRIDCGEDQNKIVTEIESLVTRIDNRDQIQDIRWEKVVLHMGKVQQFMEVKK